MRPEAHSRRLFSITRAKEKMFEFGLSEEMHLKLPPDEFYNPATLFVLTISILGDYAANLCEGTEQTESASDNVEFAARFFDAYLGSQLGGAAPEKVLGLAASAYYLAGRPGSSVVLARRMASNYAHDFEGLMIWLLNASWEKTPEFGGYFKSMLWAAAVLMSTHFLAGESVTVQQVTDAFQRLRESVYVSGTAEEVLYVDICVAVAIKRLASSSWVLLPRFTNVGESFWKAAITRPKFPKELWESQILLGQAGVFNGRSAVIQMPTSAGKTRSLEIILRSAFLANRVRLAVIVVPFRALCHEVGVSLDGSFEEDDVKINELTDALQLDFMAQLAEMLGQQVSHTKYILVVTPEKLLYVLRQQPELSKFIGLVAYDEGHQFDSGARGIVYELLLTELKALLSAASQTLLISSVIKNAQAVGEWLIGEGVTVVDGTTLLPTSRSVAFASWAESLGRLMFFDSNNYKAFDYFVPKVIEQQTLDKKKGDKKVRHFPERGDDAAKDVSLYLGVTLAREGAVAVFCGLKATADNMATRVVEVYGRNFDKPPPATYSDASEIKKMCALIGAHFGIDSDLFKAARLGVFVHHGNTPQGLRLAIEYGMQSNLLRFVACTSTLAQGVNLPIRYLIVSSVYQGGDRIKTRDFLNLVGRAGRAGMHTEGLVIFADPSVMAEGSDGWKFDMSVNLLAQSRSEDTTSSLLDLIAAPRNEKGTRSVPMAPGELLALLLGNDDQIERWAREVQRVRFKFGFTAKDLVKQIRFKKKLLVSVESYLMSNRGDVSIEEFMSRAARLASSTLAYSLGTPLQQLELQQLFSALALHVEGLVPNHARQLIYSKTLLGAEAARFVDAWVNQNREQLIELKTNDQWIDAVWPLFKGLMDDNFFHTVRPLDFSKNIAVGWLSGVTYAELIKYAEGAKASKPWGDTQRRRVTQADVLDFCEGTLGFDCALILSAVSQFLYGQRAATDEEALPLQRFQKALKYGLPDWLAISTYEQGFSDRVIAQTIATYLRSQGYEGEFFGGSLDGHKVGLRMLLEEFPSYYTGVFTTL